MRWSVLTMTFALSAGAFAQTAPAVLTGMVVDAATQSPLGDVVVIARSPVLPGEQTVVTDSSGAFEMTLLPPGTYSLAVKRDGFQTYSPEGLVLKGGRMRVRIASSGAHSAPQPRPGRYISSLVCCVNSTARRSPRSPNVSTQASISAWASSARCSGGRPRRMSHESKAAGSGSPALQLHTPPSPNSRNATVTRSGVVCMMRA